MMWMEYLRDKLAFKWLSTNFKNALLMQPIYGPTNELWGRASLGNIVNELSRKGEAVLYLSGGVEEIVENDKLIFAGPPEWIVDNISERLKTYKNFEKSQNEIKQLIAEWYKKEYGLEIDSPSEVALIPGAAFGVDACIRTMVGPGDDVLIMDPDYLTYQPQVASMGAKAVRVPLKEKHGEWGFDVQELEKRLNPLSKLLIMSNSNNPSGFLYTTEDLEGIAQLAKKYDFIVLHDQVTEEFVFDKDEGYELNCLASLPGMKERTVVVSSFSKMYNVVFWRAGWVVANSNICENILRVMWWATDGPVTPGIEAALAILKEDNRKEREKYVSQKLRELKRRRDHMKKRLKEMEGVIPNTPRAHYWAWPNVSSFNTPSQELAKYLLKEAKLYVRPGTWYGLNGEGHFRLSFDVPFDYMNKALDRMEDGLSKLAQKQS
jgi:aminotransferase